MEEIEKKISLVESLIKQFEEYVKTIYELFKLKAVDKISSAVSLIISRLCAVVILLMFILILNIAVALWLGELLGKNYYGFFCLAAFYGLLWIVLHFLMHNWIKKRVSNSIISKVFN
jgi:ABC-type dipeptide/oligopeptide/nickel transport system permease component